MHTGSLYQALRTCQPNGGCTLATVLDGKFLGEQLLLCGAQTAWHTAAAQLLPRSCGALQHCTASGILKLEGSRVFVERFGAAPQLVVCGGGHVAVSVVRLAKLLGLPVLAIEDREEYAQALRAAGADTVLCQPFEQALETVPGGAETYFIVVTRAHTYDVECLKKILRKPAAYVGMMGSRGRSGLVRRQLLEAGLDAGRVEALYAPIGLAIGSQSAEEIALSILAQVVQIKNARTRTEGFPPPILDAMGQADASRTPVALAAIVARHGSMPREVGAKMLVFPDGKTVGSIGGGIMEYRAVQAAKQMLAGQAAPQQLAAFSADGKNEDAALAACGGSMDVWLQVLANEETML